MKTGIIQRIQEQNLPCRDLVRSAIIPMMGSIGRIPEARDQEHQAGRSGTDAKNMRVKEH